MKPISVEKARRSTPHDACTPREITALRSVVGAMQWPASQSSPVISTTVSLRQATMDKALVQDLLEANKDLRFLKTCADIKLIFECLPRLPQWRIGCYSDASWASRPDGSSQGGYLVFVAGPEDFSSGKTMVLNILDWSSRKLDRKCRSSLAAEAQAAANAVDALEWTKVYVALILNPTLDPREDATMATLGNSVLVTDSKGLYDASTSVTAGRGISEKRTSIEVSGCCERMKAAQAAWRWTNGFQQVADGLTKVSARQAFAETLRKGKHALIFDPAYTAGKKAHC